MLLIFSCIPIRGMQAAAAENLTFMDALKKEVTLKVPAQRIVVVNSDAAEILCAIGAADRIVGISNYIAQNSIGTLSDLKGKPVVGSPQGPSLEKIAELAPDLVISYEMWLSKTDFEDKLKAFGIPVARITCYLVDRLETDILLLGRISGKEANAEQYAAFIKEQLDIVENRLQQIRQPVRGYTEGYGDYVTVSRGIGAAMILQHAGVINIADDLTVPYPAISAEWVVVQNPDVIIKAAGAGFIKTGYGISDTAPLSEFRGRILARPGWHNIDAVRNDRVYLVSAEIWTGPRAPVGILYIAKWCYPELFADIDPRAVHRQWLKKWHHKTLQGIYVYPQ